MYLRFVRILVAAVGEPLVAIFTGVGQDLQMFGVDVIMQRFGIDKLCPADHAGFLTSDGVLGDHGESFGFALHRSHGHVFADMVVRVCKELFGQKFGQFVLLSMVQVNMISTST